MGKQPYIPLYIGDWEQDTNCLSLEAEAGWLKIIFKMFKGDKSGVYKTSTKALQNLWKGDTNKVQSILNELGENDICRLEIGEVIVFTNRRMEKAAKISEIRTNAVQNRYKDDTNDLHPSEGDNEYEYESNNINIPFENFWNLYDKKRGDRHKIEKKWANLSDQDRKKAMEYIPKYKQSQSDKQYRKDPSTFLNNKSWNDELIFSNGNRTNKGGSKSAGAHAVIDLLNADLQTDAAGM